MPDVVWTAILAPLALLLAGFILNEMVRPYLTRRRGDAPSSVVGATIPATVDAGEPWRLAHDAVMRERDDALGDFARYRRVHDACHRLLRDHGLRPPHDED
ncbi:hypothetical protein [Janibacter sp. LM]|uniref:hypothetical protein n=1 Tax=Janibacter sp. LM TaxID=3144845 RepID=UPI0031F6211E